MGFFLETHNVECSFGGHFCDQQRDHGPSILTVSTQAEPGRGNEKKSALLMKCIRIKLTTMLKINVHILNKEHGQADRVCQTHF